MEKKAVDMVKCIVDKLVDVRKSETMAMLDRTVESIARSVEHLGIVPLGENDNGMYGINPAAEDGNQRVYGHFQSQYNGS